MTKHLLYAAAVIALPIPGALGTTQLDRPELAGTIIASQTFTFTVSTTGLPTFALNTWVVRETATSTLDFYYQLRNPNDIQVDEFTYLDISGFDVRPGLDIGVRTDLSGIPESFQFFESDPRHEIVGIAPPRTTTWFFPPHSSSQPIFIHTSAIDFQATGGIFIEDLSTDAGFAPAITPIPEPSTLALTALASRTRRR